MEKLYTRREAASLLGISLTSLDTARSSGAIAFIQYVPNGSVFFTEGFLRFPDIFVILPYAIKLDNSNEYNYYCSDRKVWEEIGYFRPEAV